MEKYGALPSQDIVRLIESEFIVGAKDSQINPSSLDLTVAEMYEVRGAFQVPYDSTVHSILSRLSKRKLLRDEPLMPGKSYVAKIIQNIDLPSNVYGYANPKSTTGRLDLHAKLLADYMPQNDALRKGFSGELWVYLRPQSFPIFIKPETPLTQVRLFYSNTRLHKEQLEFEMHAGLLFNPDLGGRIFYKDMQIQDSEDSVVLRLDGGISSTDSLVGYQAKKTKNVIDYTSKYDYKDFFEPIYAKKDGLINIRPNRFYILSSFEWVSVPPHLACEMLSIDDRFGEFRAHYAGFIDPGWGWDSGKNIGRPLTLEVRSFENLFVTHGQPVARIKFEKLFQIPDRLYEGNNSNYTNQFAAKLAKQFSM